MKIQQRRLDGNSKGYWGLLGGLALLALIGLFAVFNMEHHGHIITGMDNQIVWGLPHVFAVFLVVAASGALNVASMASVFGKTEYKPLAPLSGLLALALLMGGLVVLLLDLGRPDRLLVAMTHFNFKSIFAWNIFLYTGFMALVLAYLWTQMENGVGRFTPAAGMAAFVWRLMLTTGTGSIFGFLVARQAYDSALLAPLFVALSLSYGTAIFSLVLMLACRGTDRPLGDELAGQLARLQAIFVATGLYFVVVYHLTNLYFTKHHGFESFVLTSGGLFTTMFWAGQIIVGGVIPLALLLRKSKEGVFGRLALSAVLVILGGFAQMYVTIIGGQSFPLVLFPGYEVSSTFHDGVVNSYWPSIYELLLGLGGVSVVGIILMLAMKFLSFLPQRLDNEVWSGRTAAVQDGGGKV